jgi:ribosomal protein S20
MYGIVARSFMPNTASATKALRQANKRAIVNLRLRKAYRDAIKKMRTAPSMENLKEAFSRLDKAAKKKVITQGKADRLKARLSTLLK